jgi:hypothetical protein
LKRAKTKAEFQRLQCVWLRASLGLSSQQAATAVGWHPCSVRRVQAHYLKAEYEIVAAASLWPTT